MLVKQKVNGIDTVRIKVFTGIPTQKVDDQGTSLLVMFHDAGEYSGRT